MECSPSGSGPARPQPDNEKALADEPNLEESSGLNQDIQDLEQTAGNRHMLFDGTVRAKFPPPPDGGRRAWLQAFMGHLMLLSSFGYFTSFGLFQSHYATSLPGATPSSISWIGSVQIFLIFLVGSVSGRALDSGHYHVVQAVGSALQIIGVFSTSVCTEYWQLFLSQGVCMGLGDGLIFCPTVALVATYFSTKRSLAMACTASGAAVGGIIFPIIAQQLQPRVGFAWTVRVMGFVILFCDGAAILLARVRLPPRKTGPLFEFNAFRELPFTLYCIGAFFNLWAVYFAYFFINTFAKTIIGVDTSTSLILLLIMNAIGGPGRIICGQLADKFGGPLNVFIPVGFCAGVLFYGWAGIKSTAELYVFCVLYGFFGGGIQSLFPACCAFLSAHDPDKMGARTGMCFAVFSLASLTGPPIAGALIQLADGGFLYAQVFGGSSLMAGTLALLGAKWAWQRAQERKLDY